MRPTSFRPLLLGLALACGDSTPVETVRQGLDEVRGFGTNPAGLALFEHVPSHLPAAPGLVLALHGCGQSANVYAQTGWNELADEWGFVVAYPQTSANGACFTWWLPPDQLRSAPEVTSLLQMVSWLIQQHHVDASKVFVTGLSAGGAMTNVLMAAAPEVFRAGGIIAGLPLGCARSALEVSTCMSLPPHHSPAEWGAFIPTSPQHPRVSLWQGTADLVVPLQHQQELLEQWTSAAGVDDVADAVERMGLVTHQSHLNDAGIAVVETWVLDGVGHGTPVDPPHGCGAATAWVLDVGVCSTRRLAGFFGLETRTDAGLQDAGLQDSGPVDARDPADAGASASLDAGTGAARSHGCASAPNVWGALGWLVLVHRGARRRSHAPSR